MNLARQLVLLLLSSSFLCQCNLTNRADVVNPTVAELDAYDVQWGLSPRKARGSPKRTVQYMEPAESRYTPPPSPAPATPAPQMREAAAPAPSVPLDPEPPAAVPTVPPSLR